MSIKKDSEKLNHRQLVFELEILLVKIIKQIC